ncbi:hypothetical protein JB92DRAFT_2826735 [Gautieria morchelliformis]|nr:hypothetical protein JB92DRAFT_2826735 [Gautieria morchelliformis]
MPVPAGDPFAPAWADPWTVKVWDRLTSAERTEWLEANPAPPAQPSAKSPPVQRQARTRRRLNETASASTSKNKRRKVVDVSAKAGGTMGNMGEPRGGGHAHEQNMGHPDADELPDTLDDLMNQARVEPRVHSRVVPDQSNLDPALLKEDQEDQQLRMVERISTQVTQAISGTMPAELQGIRDELAVLRQANSKLTAPGDWEDMKERGLTGQYKTFKKEILRARDAACDEIEDSDTCPSEMKDAGYRPDSKCLYELAKTTWRGLKDRYLKQTDPRKKKMGQKNQRTARWMNMYGFDPSPLLHQDYQSDEASGPEDDLITEENATDMMALWKRNLMEIDGLEGSVDKFNFFEVIHPTWRSHWATTILHKLSDIRDAALTTKDKAAICRIRVYTSRYSISICALAVRRQHVPSVRSDPRTGLGLGDIGTWWLWRKLGEMKTPYGEDVIDASLRLG